MLETFKYTRGSFQLIDQTKLPLVEEYVDITNTKLGFIAIRTMQVRGAPAIALAGILAVATHLYNIFYKDMEEDGISKDSDLQTTKDFIIEQLNSLKTSRPTAVNLFQAIEQFTQLIETETNNNNNDNNNENKTISPLDIVDSFIKEAELMLKKDEESNRKIGLFGMKHISDLLNDDVVLLTHCNAGALATAKIGTALGVVRALHAEKKLQHCYCTETRPYNQGARLTSFELLYEEIPSTLITDSTVGYLMKKGSVNAVVVGADRIAANGDTANKIGTYNIAVLAKHHSVKFFVAAPLTTIDLSLESGELIPIEERSPKEITHFREQQVTPNNVVVMNPAFDVTPADLIDGIITDIGVITKESNETTFNISEWIAENQN